MIVWLTCLTLLVPSLSVAASLDGSPFTMDGFETRYEVKARPADLGAVSSERLPVVKGIAGWTTVEKTTEDANWSPRGGASRTVRRRAKAVVVQVGDIFVKAVRGPRTDLTDPSERYEVDTCVMRNGEVIFRRFGGHADSGLIPECAMDIDSSTHTAREESWPSIEAADLALKAVSHGLSFTRGGASRSKSWLPEERAVIGSIHAVGANWSINESKHNLVDFDAQGRPFVIGKEKELANDLGESKNKPAQRLSWMNSRAQDVLPGEQLASTSSLDSIQSVIYQWYAEKWHGRVEYFGTTLGWHSAMVGGYRRTPPYQYRSLFGQWCACNHGRCPYICDSYRLYTALRDGGTNGMYYKCGFTLRPTNRGNLPYLAYCQTFYSPIWLGGHVCNDDTLVEYRSILDNLSHAWDLTCWDNYSRLSSPTLPVCDT